MAACSLTAMSYLAQFNSRKTLTYVSSGEGMGIGFGGGIG